MSFADSLLLFTALLVGAFAGWRNATAGALVAVYFIVRGAWWIWGVTFDWPAEMMFDATVLAVIYCKPPAFDCYPYDTMGAQLCAIWLERSHWDRIVIALFAVAWAAYVLPISDYHRWWAMYWCALAQLLAAGAETLSAHVSTRTAKRASPPDPPGFMYAPPGLEGSYG